MAFADTATLKDDFNRADAGDLGANWTEPAISTDASSNWTIATNRAAPGGGSAVRSSAYYNVATYGANYEAYFTIATGTKNGRYTELYGGLHDFAAPDGYAVRYAAAAGTDAVRIFRIDDNTFTQLGADISQEMTTNEKLGIERSGTAIAAYRYAAGAWAQLGTRTDGTYTSAGYVGIGSNHTFPAIDDFYAGTVGGGGGGTAVPVFVHHLQQQGIS
jgi:hypothetical protein